MALIAAPDAVVVVVVIIIENYSVGQRKTKARQAKGTSGYLLERSSFRVHSCSSLST